MELEDDTGYMCMVCFLPILEKDLALKETPLDILYFHENCEVKE